VVEVVQQLFQRGLGQDQRLFAAAAPHLPGLDYTWAAVGCVRRLVAIGVTLGMVNWPAPLVEGTQTSILCHYFDGDVPGSRLSNVGAVVGQPPVGVINIGPTHPY